MTTCKSIFCNSEVIPRYTPTMYLLDKIDRQYVLLLVVVNPINLLNWKKNIFFGKLEPFGINSIRSKHITSEESDIMDTLPCTH